MSTRTFVLAALGALIAMGAVGTGAAMATGSTALCSADENPCGHTITHVHEVSLGKVKFLDPIVPVDCNLLFLGDTSGLGNPLVVKGNYTYTSCSNNCSVTEKNGPAEIKILKVGHETANVNYEFEVHILCAFLKCTFNGNGLLGIAKGPLLAGKEESVGETVVEEEELSLVSGLFCPSAASLDFTLFTLGAAYIST